MVCPSLNWANKVLASLTKVINLLMAGPGPSTIIPHHCGTMLLAIKKKNEAQCPIVIKRVLIKRLSILPKRSLNVGLSRRLLFRLNRTTKAHSTLHHLYSRTQTEITSQVQNSKHDMKGQNDVKSVQSKSCSRVSTCPLSTKLKT